MVTRWEKGWICNDLGFITYAALGTGAWLSFRYASYGGDFGRKGFSNSRVAREH